MEPERSFKVTRGSVLVSNSSYGHKRTGLADAYRAAMAQALASGYERIVQMDADGSHRAEESAELIGACFSDDALVIGSRWMPGGRVENWSWFRQLLSRGGKSIRPDRLDSQTAGHDLWIPSLGPRCTSSLTRWGEQDHGGLRLPD